MSQSRSTFLPGTKARRDEEQKNDKTDTTYKTTDAQTKRDYNRGTALCNKCPGIAAVTEHSLPMTPRLSSNKPWQATSFLFPSKLITTKTCLYNFDPLKPHFYIVKLGFTGVYIIFLISDQNIDCWYLLESPRRGDSNGYPQSMFWKEIWKISEFLSENFQFLVMKFSIHLNRRVFIMYC